jgi:hypothetical protein
MEWFTMPLTRQDNLWLLDILLGPMDGARQRRKFIEYTWLQNYATWQGWSTYSYHTPLPDGAYHYFLPHARRTIERGNSRIKKLLLPRSKFFQTLPRDAQSHEHAEAVDAYIDFVYTEKIEKNRLISSLARSLQLYNFSVLSTSPKIEHDEVWPAQKDVDPFSFYVFPETATTRDEAQLIFEDLIIPYQVYYSLVDRESPSTSLYDYIPVDKLHTPVWPYHLVERLAYRGLNGPSDFSHGVGRSSLYRTRTEQDLRQVSNQTLTSLAQQAKAFVQLSKVYFRIQGTWYYCVICYNIQDPCVIRVDEEENTPLYRWANERPVPGELYTNSQMDDIRELDTLANNALSQVESNRSVVAEPPVARDRNLASRTEQYVYKPRAIWDVEGDPSNIFKTVDVHDTGPEGLRAFQIYLGLMDRGNGGTIAEGQPGRNMPRAGFAVNSLVNLSLTDTEDSAACIEESLLTPGLGDIYHVTLEYIPTSQLLQIPGKAGQIAQAYNKLDLRGNYSFKWVSALEFRDVQQVADSLMKFLEILANPQTMQLLQANGFQIDFAVLIQTLYTYSIGESGLTEIIKRVPLPVQGVPGQAAPGQLGTSPPSQPGTPAPGQPGIQQFLQGLHNGSLS